jgi:serine protease Do
MAMKRVDLRWVVSVLLFTGLAFGGCEKKEEKAAAPPAPIERTEKSVAGGPGAPIVAAPGSFSNLAKQASPSVVNISAVRAAQGGWGSILPFGDRGDPFREFFERFFGERMPRDYKQQSLGSGFIIDETGYILTNNHVVQKTEEIEVTLMDDRVFKAEVVGRDPETDLALIRIQAENLRPLPLGNSDALEVGDWVVAIGSPFGLGHTVTAGIVSAKYRRIGAGAFDEFIQTDASINPGNSGGPLLNARGEVVGINSAIFSPSGGNIGIGFAVPVNMARNLLPQLKEGKVVRGWLGVLIQDLTPELKAKLGTRTEAGVLISDVTEGGPADKAGIRRGDVIISFDRKEVSVMNDLPRMVADTPLGKVVPVEVLRGRDRKSFEVKIGKRPEEKGT